MSLQKAMLLVNPVAVLRRARLQLKARKWGFSKLSVGVFFVVT